MPATVDCTEDGSVTMTSQTNTRRSSRARIPKNFGDFVTDKDLQKESWFSRKIKTPLKMKLGLSAPSSPVTAPASPLGETTITSATSNDSLESSFTSMGEVTTVPETQDNLMSSTPMPSPPGLQTLLSESNVDALPRTQPEYTVTVLQQRLFDTTYELNNAKHENQKLQEQIKTKAAQVTTLESEVEKLKESVSKGRAQNKLIEKLDIQKKQISERDSEIKKLREQLSNSMAVPNVKTSNRFEPIQDLCDGSKASDKPNPAAGKMNAKTNPINNATQNTLETHYFRGWWDPLSPFYRSSVPLRNSEGKTFITAEHWYQYEKARYHNNSRAANEIRFSKTPGDAKRTAKRYFKNKCKPEWHHDKVDKMTKIMEAKAEACHVFKDALLNTGNKTLVHNMEDDSEWGFGRDGKGKNLMGLILERVRHTLTTTGGTRRKTFAEAASSSPQSQPRDDGQTSSRDHATLCDQSTREQGATAQPPVYNTVPPTGKVDITVFGNSNVRGLSAELQQKGLNAIEQCLPGKYTEDLMKTIKDTKIDSQTVLIHTGDLDARSHRKVNEITRNIKQLTQDIKLKQKDVKIIMTTPSVQVRSHRLRNKLHHINYNIMEMCAGDPNMIMIDCGGASLRDNVHFHRGHVRELANTIAHMSNKCF